MISIPQHRGKGALTYGHKTNAHKGNAHKTNAHKGNAHNTNGKRDIYAQPLV